MKIAIESTAEIVVLVTPAGEVPARVWEGHTATGIPVQVLVTRISCPLEADCSQFERELQEVALSATYLEDGALATAADRLREAAAKLDEAQKLKKILLGVSEATR